MQDATASEALADSSSDIDTSTRVSETGLSVENIALMDECSICLDNEICKVDMVKLNCDHKFCGDCIYNILKSHSNNTKTEIAPRCALCRASVACISTCNSDILYKLAELCVNSEA